MPIGRCPMKALSSISYKDTNCFVLKYKGYFWFIPQFELARALFFRDAFMAQAAFEHGILDVEFQIDRSNEEAILINILEHSTYPVSLFKNLASRQYLGWILLDPQARQSYESIARYQLLDGDDLVDRREWNFRFDPPPLEGVGLRVRCIRDESVKCIFVQEILGITDLVADVPEVFKMSHPKSSTPGTKHTEGKSPIAPEAPEQIFVHDDDIANADTSPRMVATDKIDYGFKNAFKVIPISETEKGRSSLSIPDDEGKEVVSQDVSMNESVVGSAKNRAEWNALNDRTDNDHLFERKFTCFSKMVDKLKDNRWCEFISLDTNSLPRRGRSKKHLLSTDGSSRCVAIVQFKIRNKHVVFLEIDTSDAEKALSTMVILVRDAGKLKYQIGKIMAELVSSSLRWPTELLSDYYGKDGHRRIFHPESKSGNKGVLLPSSANGWANRCLAAVRKLR